MTVLSSIDARIASCSSDQTDILWWSKVTSNAANTTAGRWLELFTATGDPPAGAWSGSAGVATSMSSSTTGAARLGADVSPATRYLNDMFGQSFFSTMGPGSYMLVDLLLYYPALVVTGTPTTLDNSVTLPRYTDGVGVRAAVCVQTALGAATPQLTFAYDNTSNTQHTAQPVIAQANSQPISAILQPSAYTGSPNITMVSADTGIKKLKSYTIDSGSTTGTVCAFLYKRLDEIILPDDDVVYEKEFMYNALGSVVIKDGACLAWIGRGHNTAIAASSVINFGISTIW